MIHVVVDSTAQVPTKLLDIHKNLHVVPLKVIIGEQQWPENELSSSELFRLSKSTGIHPKTSQPAPGDFIKVFKPLIDAGHQIVVITLSGGISGTVGSARSAADMVDAKKIRVIDSGTTAMGIVQMAKTALAMGLNGHSIDDIAGHLRKMAVATYTLIVPDTLEYLHKGGRIGGAAAVFGTILQIKPLLCLADGKIAVLEKIRTRQRALTRMIDELKKHERLAYIGVGYVGCQQEAEEVVRRIGEIHPETQIIISELGSVLGAHLGTGLIGLIYQAEE